ncbi:RNA-directed DNA polymerase [Bertholletia excelsa]
MGDFSLQGVEGVGTVAIRSHDNKINLIQGVNYVSGLRRNLLSEGMFDDLGYNISTSQGKKLIKKNGRVVFRSSKRSGLYVVESKTELTRRVTETMVNKVARTCKESQLWHARLDHVGNPGLI